jgi:lipopolysaccharide transport system ATP-binding protein
MTVTAIEARGLGKRYTIRPGPVAGSRMLREDVMSWLRRAAGQAPPSGEVREVWAVRDVDLEIQPGEVFGLIGHNGAGKSTLLRLLARITAPTEGRARVRGRVGTLLEIGTGFHFELTGRENVFLNASVLGMRNAEVTRRLPDIIEMANIGDYLDVPVKRYSSGMFVRLAFAIAAHLEPEVLLIDEILAVGDAEFRRRCLATIHGAVAAGRTVVFVSHDAAAVERVCGRVAYMRKGRIDMIGPAPDAVRRYHDDRSSVPRDLSTRSDREGSLAATVGAIELADEQGRGIDAVAAGAPLALRFRYACGGAAPSGDVRMTISVNTHLNTPVFVHDNELTGDRLGPLAREGAFTCMLPRAMLPASVYRVSYRLSAGGVLIDALADAFEMRVIAGDVYGTGLLPDAREAACLVEARWRAE